MKNQRLHIRISPEEKIELLQKAATTGLSLSDFSRRMLLHPNIPFLTEEDRKLVRELKSEMRAAINLRNEHISIREKIDPTLNRIRYLLKRFR